MRVRGALLTGESLSDTSVTYPWDGDKLGKLSLSLDTELLLEWVVPETVA